VREKGTLRIRLGKTDNQVWVMFQDDGPGIQPEILSNIFDPFYTTKRPGRGTGLGLSICKAVLKEHGGNIEARSAQGGGAVFTVTLPIQPKA
jgi:signal transduction histidine kinase